MRSVRAWFIRLGGLFRTARGEGELAAELESHLQLHVDDNVRAGMTPEEGRRDALIRLGGVEATKDRYRDRRSIPLLDTLRQDLVYAVRTLRRNPGFAATAVATLALGIGANTAIFSLVNAVLLQPLPFADPGRLVMIFAASDRNGGYDVASYPELVDWNAQNRSLVGLAAYAGRSFTIETGGDTVLVQGKRVTPGLLDILGAQPAIGRRFRADEQAPGASSVIILSDGFWKRHYAGAADVLGKTLRANEETYTIVGVMPPTFHIDRPESEQVYVPLLVDPSRGHGFLRIVGRLRPGVSAAQAQADLAAICERLARLYPKSDGGVTAHVMPLTDALARNARAGLFTMIGVVALVLLIACTNVAGLMLARGASREREMALRAALGAGRGRLTRQLLTESLLLACAGGAIGLLVADWMSRALAAVLSAQFRVPRVDATHTDVWVLGFTVALSITTGVLFGLAPAWSSASPDLNDALREGSHAATGARAPRLRSGLVILETALALVLLAGAGVLLKTFLTLRSTAPGFDSANMLIVDLWMPQPRFEKLPDRAQFYDGLRSRLGALPGVRSAALVADLPLNDSSDSLSFHIVGRPDPAPGKAFGAGFNVATAGYFKTMGIAIRKGREFTDADQANTAGVVVINETAERRFWPAESALGQQILLPQGPASTTSPAALTLTVVGVTGDVHQANLAIPPRPEIFLNAAQSPLTWSWLSLAVRAHGDPISMSDVIKATIRDVNPNVPIQRVNTMDDVVARSIVEPRVYAVLLGSFALLAVSLSAIGLYGLVSYTVSQRTHELGIRLALGAARGEILRLVLGQALGLAASGAAIGLVGAVAATRLLVGLIKAVEPNDPVTFAGVTLLLLAAALAASYVPARRASRVDPVTALRAE
jgi:predicted permease